jgi:hypothetical protein
VLSPSEPRRLPLAGFVAAAALLATASPARASWQDDLAAQPRWDHECLVQGYSGVVDGRLLVIAKAHCEDGRTFDAIQRDELLDFEITACTPTSRPVETSDPSALAAKTTAAPREAPPERYGARNPSSDAHCELIAIFLALALTSGGLGRLIESTPFLKVALALLGSAANGRVSDRENEP